jgi:Bifunctional DNA primase/polymerase, N-terminal/Primase C terminal 2 (PriCT-2)
MREHSQPPPPHDAGALLDPLQAEVERLYASGYTPVPLAKDEKNPRLRRWTQSLCYRARPTLDGVSELVAQQVLNRGANGLGVAMRDGLVCVDIDKPDAKQRLEEIIGPDMDDAPTVVGRRGDKRFFRTQDGKNHTGLNLHVDHLLDLLVRGRQAVIPPTVHPETGQPYYWQGPSLSEVPIEKLPTLSYAVIEAIHCKFGKAPSKREHARAAHAAGHDVPKDILRHLAPPRFERASGRSTGHPDEARRLAEALTFLSAKPYTDWLKVGMALCRWGGADARPLWDTWSGGGEFLGHALQGCPDKFGIGAQDDKWRSFAENTASGVTVGTIIYLAKKRGFDASLARWPGLRGRHLEASNIGDIAAHMPPEREAIDALLHFAREDPDLTGADRDVLAALADYVNNANRTAWPSPGTIAAHLDISPKTLSNRLTRVYGRGYLLRDPEAVNPDGTQGCWAFVPPDELAWDELIELRRLALGHGERTAARGLDVETEDKAPAAASGQPLGEAVEDLAAIAAKVKDIDIRADMWTVLQEVESGRRASEVLFGPLAAKMPAALIKRVDGLATTATKAVARLVAALLGAIQSVAAKHAELERLKSERWFDLLPPRVQDAVGHAVLGKQRTVQVEKLEELMRAATGLDPQYRSVHAEILHATVSRADAGLDWDFAKKRRADAAALSPVLLLRKFRAGILAHFVRHGVEAPGVSEFAESLQRGRVATAQQEEARRQAEEQILNRRRTAA